MQEAIVPIFRCPVTGSSLTLQRISPETPVKGAEHEISDGILWAAEDWFYPVINGVPRLIPESFIDYKDFLSRHLPDYEQRAAQLQKKYKELIDRVVQKNKRTRESFAQEWALYNYDNDKTWDADPTEMLTRFYRETHESRESVHGKWIFDAGCGNGLLDILIAEQGANVVAMDFSTSIERPAARNRFPNLVFVQGDVECPPFEEQFFDIVHSSGVLHHTADTEQALEAVEACVKPKGKISIWLYHPRKNLSHQFFNWFRKHSSKWPLQFQYYFYRFTIFPVSFAIKKLKGNPQNSREMMIDILDWFTPEYRWEHEPSTVFGWLYKRNYEDIRVTTKEKFGFNMIGTKKG